MAVDWWRSTDDACGWMSGGARLRMAREQRRESEERESRECQNYFENCALTHLSVFIII
ncbi:hypothetical protein M6B38_277765 [Iris pallida]|uniref:Uncharacterized protein n=1 Tax=Iris pallida TaxID=29817 RepID=A0AAX6I2K6_IRIPA|nr:hypothetical protein M6B38_163030 [Iris pallida]KAJ6847382.1 hypothetical protein M6B38_277765 [Iris pallida]